MTLTPIPATELAIDDAGRGQVRPELWEQVLETVAGSTAEATQDAYRRDWARFAAWAAGEGYIPLPAAPAVVAGYLTAAAAEFDADDQPRYKTATLIRWVASINQIHRAAGHPGPGRSERVRRTLGGIKRQHGTRPSRRDPLLLTDLRALLGPLSQSFGAWPAGIAARRDTALLLLGFTLAARRSELTTLTLGNLTLHGDDGLHVLLRRSKTDQEGRGQIKAAPRGRNLATCTPCAITRWVQLVHAADHAADKAADTAQPTPDGRDGQRLAVMPVLRRQTRPVPGDGHVCRDPLPVPADPTAPVFRVVHRTGRIYPRAMGGDAVNQVIARRAAAAGWPPEKIALLGGHSLRSGFITEGFRAGGDPAAIMRQTGHRNPAQLETYRREHSPLVGNIVQQLDL
ncbi:hypothetical protein [Micromonospora sp.]|uniref:hypothetical protein n=1 Tax=Micromonospora sp. TaxID=1876 RepID=UPI003B3BBB45